MMKAGEFLDRGGTVAGWRRVVVSGATLHAEVQTVYTDAEGEYWIDTPDGVSYVGARPEGRIYASPAEARYAGIPGARDRQALVDAAKEPRS